MGVETTYDPTTRLATIRAKTVTSPIAPYELVRTMRASVLVLGPLVARFGQAKVSLPGGCSIGGRPVNLHLMALEKMGATIEIAEGYIHARCRSLKGAEIEFPQISVGATENTIMAAVLANGRTIIKNAAREPEITDLAKFLNSIGAKIQGAGTATIEIEGVEKLHAGSHRVVSDRIEAGTYLIAGAITEGDVTVENIDEDLLGAFASKLRSSGCDLTKNGTGLRVRGARKILPVSFFTEPFPGFATDMQAQFMALLTMAHGVSVVTENIFENRFMHVAELLRLGAKIAVAGNKATIEGLGDSGRYLSGASVMATDLRASACLVLAGLAAKGETTVKRIYHLDRGYERMEENLTALGAEIRREKDPD